MGSPLGPLMANAFMCKLEASLETEDLFPRFYRRYVDDTIAIFPTVEQSEAFLVKLNSFHPSIQFTVETTEKDILPFLGIQLRNNNGTIATSVHRKSTNKGLLLHFHSSVDSSYKSSLLKTMILRAYSISSSWNSFHEECLYLHRIFVKLQYPSNLVQRTINSVLEEKLGKDTKLEVTPQPVQRIVLPFKSQKAVSKLKTALGSLNAKIGSNIRPSFTSKKVKELIAKPEKKDSLVSQACVVYNYRCTCEMCYVGQTARHLHQRIAEHSRRTSAIYKHCLNSGCTFSTEHFSVIAKCYNKFDCRVREAIEIYFRKPSLNNRDEFRCTQLFKWN